MFIVLCHGFLYYYSIYFDFSFFISYFVYLGFFLSSWWVWPGFCKFFFTFSKNQLLVLLIFSIVFWICILLISSLIFMISFLLPTYVLFVLLFLIHLGGGLKCWFEIFSSFLGRPVLLWISFWALLLQHPIDFCLFGFFVCLLVQWVKGSDIPA